jgi:hypothetical protein
VVELSIILQNTEEICRRIQTLVETLDPTDIDAKSYGIITSKITDIIASVSRSKKKIMVRTEKGKELSTDAQNVACELENIITEMQKSSVNTASQDAATTLITQLEKEVSKVETYWKSYEAAIT